MSRLEFPHVYEAADPDLAHLSDQEIVGAAALANEEGNIAEGDILCAEMLRRGLPFPVLPRHPFPS
jgi:hypothetical protein